MDSASIAGSEGTAGTGSLHSGMADEARLLPPPLILAPGFGRALSLAILTESRIAERRRLGARWSCSGSSGGGGGARPGVRSGEWARKESAVSQV